MSDSRTIRSRGSRVSLATTSLLLDSAWTPTRHCLNFLSSTLVAGKQLRKEKVGGLLRFVVSSGNENIRSVSDFWDPGFGERLPLESSLDTSRSLLGNQFSSVTVAMIRMFLLETIVVAVVVVARLPYTFCF